MALQHARPLDVIDVRPPGGTLPGIVTTPSRPCELGAGRLVVLEPGEPHALQAVTDASLLVTLMHPPD